MDNDLDNKADWNVALGDALGIAKSYTGAKPALPFGGPASNKRGEGLLALTHRLQGGNGQLMLISR